MEDDDNPTMGISIHYTGLVDGDMFDGRFEGRPQYNVIYNGRIVSRAIGFATACRMGIRCMVTAQRAAAARRKSIERAATMRRILRDYYTED